MEYPKFDVPAAPRGPEPYTGKIPAALHYSVVIRPKPPIKQIGSIALASRTKRANLATECIGQLLAKGQNAFKGKTDLDMQAEMNWPQVGEWCVYRQNAGQRLRLTGELDRVTAEGGSAADEVHLLVMNDTDIICKISEADVYAYYSWVA